jgi:tripartite-type tricarboxylate transporter receptor subunit TctC
MKPVAMHRRTFAAVACAALAMPLVTLCGPVAAQDRPPMRVILPVSAGSGVDTITRALSNSLSKALGQSVVVENLPGAGGVSGTAAIVKSRPDGTVIGLISNNHVINPSVYSKMPFDSIEDITPIMVLGTTPLMLIVNPKVPAKNVKELIAFLKAKPGAYNYASSGNGTIIHLAGAMFVDEAGVDVKHVPYKGVGPMVIDMISGQVELGVVALPAAQGHLKNGTLRAIGVGGRSRTPAAAEIPTIAEQGLPNYEAEGWIAVIGPAKLPEAEVRRIHAAFVAALADPDVKENMVKQGNMINPTSPEEAGRFFRSELAKYAKLVKKAGIKLD